MIGVWRAIDRHGALIAGLAALGAFVVGLAWGTNVAGGPDSYCYLNQAELFEKFGESDFRDGERRLVARLIDGTVRVIATGGGAFIDPRTRQLLNERAITVWLDASVDVLAERTGRRNNRPLLRRGEALWKVGNRSFLVHHRLSRYEQALVDTDARMHRPLPDAA